ncbi:uncharacterized protein LOC132563299 isoform X2 [Ylistrum balloti]|nr:uncharacterized protein LOC132563299 isoform X2 [Ylistrum balloti]
MEYLFDQNQEEDWPEFFMRYKDKFPLLVYIVGGNYGETTFDDFCSDQIYRVETYSEQRRIVAKASKVYDRLVDIYLSIPITTKHKFCVLKGHKEKAEPPTTLEEIVRERPFPISVKFAPDVTEIYVGNSREDVSSYATILLTREYTENFILGNCVLNGTICKGVSISAISRLISVAPVNGIKGKSADFFRKQLNNMQTALSNVRYDRTVGNPSITKITSEGTGTGNILPNIDPPLLPVEEPTKKTTENSEDYDDGMYEIPPDVGPPLPPRKKDLPPSSSSESANVPLRTKKFYENAAIVNPLQHVKQNTKGATQNAKSTSTKSVENSHTVLLNPGTLKPQSEMTSSKSEGGPVQDPNCPSANRSGLLSEGIYIQMKEGDLYEELSPMPLDAEATYRQTGDNNAATTTPSARATSSGQTHLLNLSVEEIGACLKNLNLEQYVKQFSNDMIDGVILSELEKEDLKEYGFTKVELVRLWKFITDGYIPR